MRTFYTLALLVALVLILVGCVALSTILPGLFAFAPWAAGIVSGWCVADCACEIWK